MRSFRFTHAIARRPAASIIRGLRAVDTGTRTLRGWKPTIAPMSRPCAPPGRK